MSQTNVYARDCIFNEINEWTHTGLLLKVGTGCKLALLNRLRALQHGQMGSLRSSMEMSDVEVTMHYVRKAYT